MSVVNPTARAEKMLLLPKAAAVVGVFVLAACFGALLAAVAGSFGPAGPAVLLGIALAPVLLVAMFSDPKLAVIAVLATLPVGAIALPPPLPALELAEAAVLGAATVVVLKRLSEGGAPLKWPAPIWWVFALLIWTLVAFPSAVDKSLAIKQIASLGGGILLALVTATVCSNMRDVRYFLIGFIAIGAGIAGAAVMEGGQFQAELGGTQISGRLEGAFDHPNQLGSICAMLLLSAAGFALGAKSLRSRILSIGAMVLLLAGLALSLSRGAWIGAGLGALYLALVLPQARRAVLAVTIPLVLVAGLWGSALPSNSQIQVVQERLSVLTIRSPYDDRSAIWAEAMREIKEDPLTGQGPGGFPVASVRPGSEASTVAAYHAHNVLLTWAAESGIPAAMLLVGFFVAVAIATARAGKAANSRGARKDRAVIAGMAAGLISVLGQGPVDYTWRNTVVFVAISAMVGALLGASGLATEATGMDGSPEPPEDTLGAVSP